MLLFSSHDRSHQMRWTTSVLALGVMAGGLIFAIHARAHGQAKEPAGIASPSTPKPEAVALGAGMGLRFEPNQGQTDGRVKFLSRNSQYNLFLTSDEAVFVLNDPRAESSHSGRRWTRVLRHRSTRKQSVVRMRLAGGKPSAINGSSPVSGYTNYFIGRDPKNWVRNVPQFARVSYADVYPGVDMAFYGHDRAFEFDLMVKPGADPKQIALTFSGAQKVKTNVDGDLVLTSAAGDLALRKPFAYQQIDGGRKPVDVRFIARNRNEFGLAIGAYDPAHELVIDPVVIYSTYFGGSGTDAGHATAVDATGAVYLTGETNSTDFPTQGGISSNSPKGGLDVFVSKFNPINPTTGTTLVYSTYIGGSSDDSGNALSIDAAGNVYVAGGTDSTNFPVTSNAAQSAYGGGMNDAFVIKIDPTGSNLLYATYIGGSDEEIANGLAVDSTGNMYVGGETKSTNFTVVQPLQGTNKGGSDGFIAQVDGTTGSFKFLDYLGGTGADTITGVALDGSNNVYVAGITTSTDFPVHGSSPYQTQCGSNGQCDASGGNAQDDSFITAIKSDKSQYIYSTYFGGNGGDDAETIVVDNQGDAYITGLTSSNDLKIANAYQTKINGSASNNVFVAEMNPSGSATPYVTYLGGSAADVAFGLALDSNARIYLTGQTTSPDFPTKNPTQNVFGGATDAFVTLLDPSKANGSQLIFSTFLGGPGNEDSQLADIAIDSSDNIYVTGDTASSQSTSPFFPIVNAFQPNLNTAPDAFLTVISSSITPKASFTVDVSALSPDAINVGSSATATVTVTSQNGFGGNISLACAVTPKTTVPPTCATNPQTVTLPANGTVTSTLTMGTVSPTSNVGIGAFWLPLAGLAIITPGLTGIRRRSRPFFFAACFVLTALLLMPGCVSGTGTGGGGGGGGAPGTSKGTYHFTVSGGSLGANTSAQSQEFTIQ
jgi:Beta-propeller repeat